VVPVPIESVYLKSLITVKISQICLTAGDLSAHDKAALPFDSSMSLVAKPVPLRLGFILVPSETEFASDVSLVHFV
jgi:hypothetical protein